MWLGLDAMPGPLQLTCNLPGVKLTQQRNGRDGDFREHPCTVASTKQGPSFLTLEFHSCGLVNFLMGCAYLKKGIFHYLLLRANRGDTELGLEGCIRVF